MTSLRAVLCCTAVTGPFVFVSSGSRNGISFWAFLYRYRALRYAFYVVRFFFFFSFSYRVNS